MKQNFDGKEKHTTCSISTNYKANMEVKHKIVKSITSTKISQRIPKYIKYDIYIKCGNGNKNLVFRECVQT